MLLNIGGTRYRLYFMSEEVPTRYQGPRTKSKGIRRRKGVYIPIARQVATTFRTVCSLDKDTGLTQPDPKTGRDRVVWQPLTAAVVYRNHDDAVDLPEGRRQAFTKLMSILREDGLFSKEERREIAKQYLAQAPKRPSYAQLRKRVANLEARVAYLHDRADAITLTTPEYLALLNPRKQAKREKTTA